MKSIIMKLYYSAREAIKQKGYIPPVFVGIYDDDITDPLPIIFSNDEEKIKTFFTLGAYCREKDIPAAILTLDACSRKIEKESMEYFLSNLDTERPTLYPKNLRDNHIIIQYIDFIKPENCVTLISKYKETNGKTRFQNPIFSKDVESIIVKMTINGWHAMNQEKEE